MKLHPFQRRGRGCQFAVAHAHDFTVFTGGGDFEAIGQAGALNGQRVIPNDGELLGQPGVDAAAIVADDAARTTWPPSAAPMD